MAGKKISTGQAPSHNPKISHQNVDLSARTTRDDAVRSTRVEHKESFDYNSASKNTPKYQMRWSDPMPGDKSIKEVSDIGGTRFTSHFETSKLKSGTGIKDVLVTTAQAGAQATSATQSGSTTQQVYQSAAAMGKIASKVPGVASSVYHHVRGNAYVPLKANTSTNAFAKFDAGTQLGGDHSRYENFRNYRSANTLHKYEKNKGFEYFKNTKKLRMDNGQYAVFNRKTGRMEVMEGVQLRHSQGVVDFAKKSWQKSKNGLKTQSVKWGLDAAPPESFFDGDRATFIKNRNAVLRHNAKKAGIKTGTKAVHGFVGASKAGETAAKLASGEISSEEFAKKTLKAEAKIATKPVRRVVNSRIKTYQKKIWDKTGGRVTKWAGNKFWNSKVGQKINALKKSVSGIRSTINNMVKTKMGALGHTIIAIAKSILAATGPVVLGGLAITMGVILLCTAIGKHHQDETCNNANSYDIPITETGPTNTFTYTCYDYWFDSGNEMVWAKGTAQRTVSDKWKEEGAVFEGGVAKIGNCFLVACTTKYGVVGDKIKVTLENGETFKCIIADTKSSSDSNYTEWGHKNGNSTNIIEFEVQRSYALNKGYGNVALWNSQWNWNSNVIKIDNLGENDDNTAGCTSAGLTGEGANWRPNSKNTQAWLDVSWNAYAGSYGTISGGKFNGQCTWYAAGYISEVYGIKSGMHGNGSECVNQLVAANPEYFVKSNTPTSGSIYSVPGYSTIGASQFGHVGIVLNYNSETKECTLFDGNWSGTCDPGGNYKVWVVSLSYLQKSNATFANPTKKGVALAEKRTNSSESSGTTNKVMDK